MTFIYELHQKVDYELSFEHTFVRFEQLPVLRIKPEVQVFRALEYQKPMVTRVLRVE